MREYGIGHRQSQPDHACGLLYGVEYLLHNEGTGKYDPSPGVPLWDASCIYVLFILCATHGEKSLATKVSDFTKEFSIF
jgi:hypothetical protein